MSKTEESKQSFAKVLYWVLLVAALFPYELFTASHKAIITPPCALFAGLVFALVFGTPVPKFNKKLSKYLLQASVVGLGFGMNINESLKSGSEGMLFTIVSVAGVMVIGVILGKLLSINRKTSYLVSSGTAICGGSAIAAVGGVIKANENEMAVSLGVIFILNAIALFIFPPLGHYFGLDDTQFGTWAAIAIHDTSSVVGAGDAFSPEACKTATLIKCTRALWIIPLAFFTMWYFRKDNAQSAGGKKKVSIPWFIFLFVVAMFINTWAPQSCHPAFSIIEQCAKKALVVVLFAIGAGLSVKVVRQVGVKPLVQAILLWVVIGVSSLLVVKFC